MKKDLVGFLLAIFLLGIPVAAAAQPIPDDVEYCRVHWWGVGHCWRRVHRRPALTFGYEFGVSHLNEGHPFAFGDGTGSVTDTGPTWGLRIGVDLLSWLGLEGRYFGSYNGGTGAALAGGSVGYLLSGGAFVVRLTIPTPYVRPYVFSGIGVYDFALLGSASAQSASMLNSTLQPGVPIGVGVEAMLSWHLSIAIEGTYHFQLGESFSNVDAISGADLSTLTGVMRFRM